MGQPLRTRSEPWCARALPPDPSPPMSQRPRPGRMPADALRPGVAQLVKDEAGRLFSEYGSVDVDRALRKAASCPEPHAEPLPLLAHPASWTSLMKRAYQLDLAVCPACEFSMWFSGRTSSTRSWSAWAAPRSATASNPAHPPRTPLEQGLGPSQSPHAYQRKTRKPTIGYTEQTRMP